MQFACVACEAPLIVETTAVTCEGCGTHFPVIGGVPVLVADATRCVADGATWLRTTARGLRGVGMALGARSSNDRRRDALQRTAHGMCENARVFECIAEAILPSTGPVVGRPIDREGYLGFLRNVIVDRSYSTFTEPLIASKVTAIGPLVANESTGPLVVLGCGAGRMADELAKSSPNVVGVDLSLPLLVAARLMEEHPMTVYAPHETNVRSASEIYPALELRRPAVGARLVAADALRLPFFDGSISALVSDYFTDVVPPTRLLKEARRVLEPGGIFVHFGPLGYSILHDAAEMFSVEELRVLLRDVGFEQEHESWHPHEYWPHGAMSRWKIDAWCSQWRRV